MRGPANGSQINLSQLLHCIVPRESGWVRFRIAKGGGAVFPAGADVVIHILIAGYLTVQIGEDAPIELRSGASILLPRGSSHVIRAGAGEAVRPFRYPDDAFDDDIPPTIDIGAHADEPEAIMLSGRLRIDWPEGIPPRQMLPAALFGTRSYRADQTAAASAMRALDDTARGLGASVCLSRFAELLLVRELRNFLVTRPDLLEMGGGDAARIGLAIEAIREQPGRPWSVATLARKVGLSRSGFAAKFKAVRDQTPMDAVTLMRMEEAGRLLVEGTLKAKEIAAKVGYSSDAAFIRAFSKHFGTSPTSYRKSQQQAGPSESADWLQLL